MLSPIGDKNRLSRRIFQPFDREKLQTPCKLLI